MAAFVYVNGLDPDIFLDWAEKKFLCRDRAAFQHFKALFIAFEKNKL